MISWRQDRNKARSKNSRRNRTPRSLGQYIERLEERSLLATFAGTGGNPLNIDLNAPSTQLHIVALNATSYELGLVGDTWTSGNIAGGATVSGGGALLTVTRDFFSNISVTDSSTAASASFNNSAANVYSDGISVVFDNATAGAITFSGASSFAGASALTANTSGNVNVNPGASISAAGATVTLVSGAAISGGGSVTALNLALTAVTGIGTVGVPLTTTVSNLEAHTGTGGIFIGNTGNVSIGGVSAGLFGMRVTGVSGDIDFQNTLGDVSITTAGDFVLGPDNVSITTITSGDIITANNDGYVAFTGSVNSTGGDITLDAAGDLDLGHAGNADVYGDVRAQGNISLIADGDISLDDGASAQAVGAVSLLTVTAGGNVSVLSTNVGDTGLFATTISVATGVGGGFTVDGGSGANLGVGNGVGTITIAADDMVILDDISAGATGTVTLKTVSAARPIILGGAGAGAWLDLTDAETDFVTAGTLIIGDAANTGGITLTAGGISRAGSGWTNLELRTAGVLAVADTINTGGNALTLLADQITITAAITAGAGNVTIAPITAARTIALGGADSGAQLGLTDTELDFVATTGQLIIGSAAAGPINFASQINQAGSGYTSLALLTGGKITSNAGAGVDVRVDTLSLTAAGGIGDLANALETQAQAAAQLSLTANNTSTTNGLFVRNTGSLSLAGVSSNSAATGFLQAASPLTIAADFTTALDFTFTASGSAAAGDNLTIAANVTSTGGGTLTFEAGDDIIHTSGAVTSVGGATNAVILTADTEGVGVADADRGSISQAAGTINADSLTTISDQGTVLNGANTVTSFDATNSTAGNIELTNNSGADELTLAGVSNTGGAATDAVTIVNTGAIIVSANVTATGTVTLTSTEAAGLVNDITVNAGVNVESTAAGVTLNAGDDVLISSTATVSAATALLIDTSSDTDNSSSLTVNGSLLGVTRTFTGGANPGTTLTVDDGTGRTFNVTAADAGDVTGVLTAFTGVENLVGGAQGDTFNIDAALSGTVDGAGGADTLQGTAIVSATITNLDANGADGTAGGVSGFSNIETLNGSGTLTGDDVASTWNLDGTPTYEVGANVLNFSGFTILQGGTDTDTFNVTAASTFNLEGGAGADIFDIDAALTGSVNGEGGSDTLQGDLIDNVVITLLDATGADGTEASASAGFSNIETITGNGGTLTGDDVASTWNLDGTPTYEVGANVLNFSGFANLQGGTDADTFNVTAASTFNLRGGAGADIFDIDAALTGSVDGEAGSDTLQGDLIDNVVITALDAAGADGTEASVSANFSNIETLTGNGGTLTGLNVASTWGLDGTPTYSTAGGSVNFSGFANLQGGTDADTFNVTAASTFNLKGGAGADIFDIDAALTGSVDGEAGSDTLQGNLIDNVVITVLDAAGADGTEASVSGGFSNIETLTGNGGTLTGLNVASTWGLDGTPTYSTAGGSVNFSGFANLQGGSDVDTFNVTAPSTFNLLGGAGADIFDIDAALTGSVDGEAGSDTLQGNLIDNVVITVLDAAGADGTEASVSGGFSNIETLTGNGGTLTGLNVASTWGLDGTPTYSTAGGSVNFSGFANLQGGSDVDTFNVTAPSTFNLLGGAGADIFDIDAALTGSVDGEGGADTLQGTAVVSATITNLDGNGADGTTGGVSGFSNIETLIGNGGTLTGLNVASTWGLDGTPTYSTAGGSVNFSGFANLQGGTDADTFNVTAASTFNLRGGAGADIFDIDAALTGSVDGEAGSDTLQGDLIDNVVITALDAAGADGTEASVSANFSNIETLTGNGGTLTGLNVASTWGLDGTPTYSTAGGSVNFSGFANLQGGSDVDTFNVTAASTFNLKGGAGADIFAVDAALTGSVEGEADSDSVTIGTAGSVSVNVIGGSGLDTLTNSGGANAWLINAVNGGTVTDVGGTFSGMEHLNGGSGVDTFTFTNAGSLQGKIDGGGGLDTLTGDNDGNTFVINAANGGRLDAKIDSDNNDGTAGPGVPETPDWTNIEFLVGGTGDDIFYFTNLDPLAFTMEGSLAGKVDGGAGADTLVGDSNGNFFAITGLNAGRLDVKIDSDNNDGTLSDPDWTNIEYLRGGAGVDTFYFKDDGRLDDTLAANEKNIDGRGGADILDLREKVAERTIQLLSIGDIDGFHGDELSATKAAVDGFFANINEIIGSGASAADELRGLNADSHWTLNKNLAGDQFDDRYRLDPIPGAQVLPILTYRQFEVSQGGSAKDKFLIESTIAGRNRFVRGGAGVDTFEISPTAKNMEGLDLASIRIDGSRISPITAGAAGGDFGPAVTHIGTITVSPSVPNFTKDSVDTVAKPTEAFGGDIVIMHDDLADCSQQYDVTATSPTQVTVLRREFTAQPPPPVYANPSTITIDNVREVKIVGGTKNDVFHANVNGNSLPIIIFDGGLGADNKAEIVGDVNDNVIKVVERGGPVRGDFEFANIHRATVEGNGGNDTIYFNANTRAALLGGAGNDILILQSSGPNAGQMPRQINNLLIGGDGGDYLRSISAVPHLAAKGTALLGGFTNSAADTAASIAAISGDVVRPTSGDSIVDGGGTIGKIDKKDFSKITINTLGKKFTLNTVRQWLYLKVQTKGTKSLDEARIDLAEINAWPTITPCLP